MNSKRDAIRDPGPFRPFPLLGRPHLQTIVTAWTGRPVEPPSTTRIVELPDGDRLALEDSTPPGWQPGDPAAVLLHGLCGCHLSPYLVRMAYRLHELGIRALRMNLRGCGSGAGLARKLYHSGRSEDVAAVLASIRSECTDSPLWLIGYSLGGNIVLKHAAEVGDTGAAPARVIAVCPPVDLAACSRRFSRPENRHYDRFFVKLLRQAVREREQTFPDLEPFSFPRELTLYGFDDIYTAPRSGFRDADDYYTRSSSLPLLPGISVPTDILFSRDDPLIDSSGIDEIDRPPFVRVEFTERGGHLGFLGTPLHPPGLRWVDAWILWKLLGETPPR